MPRRMLGVCRLFYWNIRECAIFIIRIISHGIVETTPIYRRRNEQTQGKCFDFFPYRGTSQIFYDQSIHEFNMKLNHILPIHKQAFIFDGEWLMLRSNAVVKKRRRQTDDSIPSKEFPNIVHVYASIYQQQIKRFALRSTDREKIPPINIAQQWCARAFQALTQWP